jgi:hypothetical protein
VGNPGQITILYKAVNKTAEREKTQHPHCFIQTAFWQDSPAIRLHDRFALSSLEEVGSESNDKSAA